MGGQWVLRSSGALAWLSAGLVSVAGRPAFGVGVGLAGACLASAGCRSQGGLGLRRSLAAT